MEVKQILGGRYELVEQVGTGGMAVVWRARDEVLGRSVAIKLLAGPYAGDPSSRRRIRDEARAAAMLSHPHIAQVYDYGESTAGGECVPYVVMELVSGGTLAQRLTAAPMPVHQSFRLCGQVAEALAAAHADGLVHRDIKPANVMVTPAGVKVVDFGIAAAIGSGGAGPGGADSGGADSDDAAELLGTPAYLAPERLTGGTVEPASDVYALGVMLYRMLAGHSPWSADTTTKMLAAHIYVDPTPLPRLPEVPDYITGLVNRCLSKDPMQRPTAREAAAMLMHAADGRAADHRPAPVDGPFPADGEPSRPLRWPSAPPVSGPPVSGLPVSGMPVSGLPVSGPPVSGRLMAAASGAPVSGPPGSAAPTSGPSWSGAPGRSAVGPSAPGPSAVGSSAVGPSGSPGAGGPVAVPALRPATPRASALRRRITVGVGAVAAGAMAALLWLVLHPGHDVPEFSAAPPDRLPAPGASAVAAATSRAPVDAGASSRPPSGPVSGPADANRRQTDQVDTSGRGQRGRAEATGAPTGRADAGDAGAADSGADPGDGRAGQDGDNAGDNAGDSGGGSDNGAGPTPTPTPTPTPAPRTERLPSDGGSVEAQCRSDGLAEILSYSVNRSYKLHSLQRGPSAAPRIEFRHGNRIVRMTISCDAGVPSTENTDL